MSEVVEPLSYFSMNKFLSQKKSCLIWHIHFLIHVFADTYLKELGGTYFVYSCRDVLRYYACQVLTCLMKLVVLVVELEVLVLLFLVLMVT